MVLPDYGISVSGNKNHKRNAKLVFETIDGLAISFPLLALDELKGTLCVHTTLEFYCIVNQFQFSTKVGIERRYFECADVNLITEFPLNKFNIKYSFESNVLG